MLANHKQTNKELVPSEAGDLLVNYLEQLDVEFVFGVPGGAIEPFYNALARSERRNGLRSITARHETGAAFMAEGYAHETGKIGVCCATTGPGTTNLITGVASAYENQSPMLVISAQTALSNFGRGALQDSSCTGVNTVAMLQHCTRYNTLVSHIDQFEQKLVTAIMTAYQSPNGPVHLSIPRDIMLSLIPTKKPAYDLRSLIHKNSISDLSSTNELFQLMKNARKIVFVLGSNCVEAIEKIVKLAELLKAPIVTTFDGKGIINPYHPLYRGVIGFAGHITANNLLADSNTDLIIAAGTPLGEWATGGWNQETILNHRLVHIESIESRLARSPMAKLRLHGRILTIFNDLLTRVLNEWPENKLLERRQIGRKSRLRGVNSDIKEKLNFRMNEEIKCRDDSTPIKPQRLMFDLPKLFPPNTCFVADSGNSTTWAIHYLHPYNEKISTQYEENTSSLYLSQEFHSMGWAIGNAIGVAMGRRDRPVVCITGDGSVLMSGQEISVAVLEQLAIVFIILNDSAYGMVKHGQRLCNAEPIAFQLSPVDFAAYAKAIGAYCEIIKSPNDLHSLNIEEMYKRPGPTILDIRIDTEEIPPMGDRVRVLNAQTHDRRYNP